MSRPGFGTIRTSRRFQLPTSQMKFGAPLTLLRFVVAFAMTQQVLPLFAFSKDSKQKEVKPKIRFTAAELMGLVPTPRAEDVASPTALVLALHDSLSGPTGPFQWDRFRSLFLPKATIGEAGSDRGENHTSSSNRSKTGLHPCETCGRRCPDTKPYTRSGSNGSAA